MKQEKNRKEKQNTPIPETEKAAKNQELSQENQEDITSAEVLIQQEKDKFLRLFAEFENYKKRTAKDRIEWIKTANEELMTALLPIADDFDRGLLEIKKVKDKELLKGIQLIYDKFKSTLIQKGLSEIAVKSGDCFDAELHEAITQIPAPSKKMEGKVVDCIEKGYKLGDKIIRYPKVVTGK